jgi:hypothetical protein
MYILSKTLKYLSTTLLIIFLLQSIPIFLEAYQKQKALLENELWREKECADITFIKKMKSLGSDFCSHIDPFHDHISKHPILVALHACLPFKALFSFLIRYMNWLSGKNTYESYNSDHKYDASYYFPIAVMVLVMIYVIQNTIIPLYILMKEKRDYLQILEECSPQLHSTHKKKSIWKHCGQVFQSPNTNNKKMI